MLLVLISNRCIVHHHKSTFEENDIQNYNRNIFSYRPLLNAVISMVLTVDRSG